MVGGRRNASSDKGHVGPVLVDVTVCKDGGRRIHIPSTLQEREFAIRFADTALGRNTGSMLVKQRYEWRGYHVPEGDEGDLQAITLLATGVDGEVFGTLELRLDQGRGFFCGETFPEIVGEKRGEDKRLCELGRFALESGDMQVFGALFHTAYIYIRRLHGCDYVLIEVNPRHAGFYRRNIGFVELSEVRECVRAGAPAVLMGLDLHEVEGWLEDEGGGMTGRARGRIFSYCFSKREEQGLFERIRRLSDPGGSYQE